jgi:hypothetical protein
MNNLAFMFIFLVIISSRHGLYRISTPNSDSILSNITEQDTIKVRQILYNGILWENKYHRIKEDQFLFSSFFLPGTVSVNGQTFKNLRIKYDIYSDEIIIPLNSEKILQVNKEMVDSFTIFFENKGYKFDKIQDDTLKGFTGYVNVLYKGESALYVKYKKEISPLTTEQYDGEFDQTHRIYLVKDNIIYPVDRKSVV